MFDLDKSIAAWRHALALRRGLVKEDLDELECHIRDHVGARTAEGIDLEAAFMEALQEVGWIEETEAEYRKVYRRKLFRLGLWREDLATRAALYQNYLVIAWRNIKRQKGYALINLFGLATGLAAALVIVAHIQQERSYDRFLPDVDHIYQVVQQIHDVDQPGRTMPWKAVSVLSGSVPGVQAVTAVRPLRSNRMLVKVGSKQFYEDAYLAADSSFFRVFAFKSISGKPEHALDAPGSAVITRSTARRYFGTTDVVGRTLITQDERYYDPELSKQGILRMVSRGDVPYTITAVIEDPPANSTFQFSFVIPAPRQDLGTNTVFDAEVYLRATPGIARPDLERRSGVVLQRAFPAFEWSRIVLRPFASLHLDPNFEPNKVPTPILYLWAYAAIAIIIVVMACVNYVNLAMARAVDRAREVGLRKVLGVRRGQLAVQFFGESAVMVLISVFLSILIVLFGLPYVNTFVGTELSYRSLSQPQFLGAAAGIILLVIVLSGGLPVLILSRIQPADILQNWTSGRSGKTHRRVLVTGQLGLSIIVLFMALVTQQQMSYVHQESLNVGQDEILILRDENGVVGGRYQALREAILKSSAVHNVTFGSPPGQLTVFSISDSVTTENPFKVVGFLRVGEGFLETLGMQAVPGSDTRMFYAGDNTGMLTRKAAQEIGSDKVIGRTLYGMTVVGIVEDFHALSFHQEERPVMLFNVTEYTGPVLVRLRAGRTEEGLKHVLAAWKRIIPERPADYSFLRDDLDQAYRSEIRMSRIFGVFSGLAVAIAGLGLTGLAAFSAYRRRKEVSIRKAMGASAPGIVLLLWKENLRLVMVAFVLGTPLAWLAARRWLALFAYKIPLGPGLFLMTALLTLGLLIVAVSYHAIVAAQTSPAENLRNE